MKAEIKLARTGVKSSVVVDGKELAGVVRSVCVEGEAGSAPALQLSLILSSAEISVEGDVRINGDLVSDEIGRKIYDALRIKYETGR